jgi:vacuolar-type H+-ATPase subunit I/STV1
MDRVLKFIEWCIEAISFLLIVLSPLIFSAVIAFIFYLYKPDIVGVIISSLFVLCGLIAGIYFAIRVTKKQSALAFNSRINASPDFDNINNVGDKKIEK